MKFFKPQKGASLPSLSSPASRDNIQAGFEAIDGTGKKVAGQLFIDKFYTKKDVAIPLETQHHAGIPYADTMLHMVESAGNATAADIVKGKTALTDDGKITGTGVESSHTFQIRTENASDGTDYIIYYEPGSSEKKTLNLSTSYQTITCGDFICINRGSSNNTSSYIRVYDASLAVLLAMGVTSKYVIDNKPNGGFSTVNIGAIVKEYWTMTKIELAYAD